jgi:TP901 family phage tail tape measure protein
MANTAATFSVGADTRQAERDIKKLVNKNYNINLTTKGEQPLGRITGKVNEFTKSLDASNARVIAFGASAGVIYGLQKAFSTLVSSTIEVQKSLTDINVILNVSTAQLSKFGGELFNIAKNTGQSFQIVAEAATEFSRQGLGVEETLKRTSQALILSRLSGLDAAKSVDALTAAVNSFASEAVSASEVVNKFANVDAAFAVSSGDLAEAISRVGSSASQSGVSLNELIAIVTSAQQTTARGGAVIGNSFKTIFTRLQRGKVIDLLGSLGISDTGANGQVKSTIQLLQDLAKVYDTLGSRQQSAIAEQVGGVFQINILKSALADLGKEYSVYNAALNTAASTTDQAIRRNEELNKTYAAQINALQQNAKQLGSSVGERTLGPVFNRVVGSANDLLGGVNESDGQGIGATLGKGILDGIGQIIAGPGLILLGGVLFKLVKDFAKFASGSVKELLGLNTATKQQADLQQSINQILSRNPELYALMQKGSAGLNKGAEILLANLRNQTLELGKQQAISAQLASQFLKSGSVSVVGGLPVAKPAKGKAAGNMPPISDAIVEKYTAISLGATSSVRPHMSQGTIGGQKFVMNDQETEYLRVGRNGDSAVVPHYGDGVQMAARGFVPNFAPANIKAIREGGIFEKQLNKYFFGTETDAGNATLDFPPNVLQKVKSDEKKQIGMNPKSFFGDAKRTENRKNQRSLVSKILRTPNFQSKFFNTPPDNTGRIYIPAPGLSMLFLNEGADRGQIASLGINGVDGSKSVGKNTQEIIKSYYKTQNLDPQEEYRVQVPYIADQIRASSLPVLNSGKGVTNKTAPTNSLGIPRGFGKKNFASGFIPNFAPIPRSFLEDLIKWNRQYLSKDIKKTGNFNEQGQLNVYRGYKTKTPQEAKKLSSSKIFEPRSIKNPEPAKNSFLNRGVKNSLQDHRFLTTPVSERPFVSSSFSKEIAESFSKQPGFSNQGVVGTTGINLSRIVNNKTLTMLNEKYGAMRTHEYLLRLTKMGGGRGMAFDMNSLLKEPKGSAFANEKELALAASGFIPNFATTGTGSVIDLGDIGAVGGSPILKGKIASLIHPGDSTGIQKVRVQSAYRGQKFKGLLPTAGINKSALKQGINIPNVVDDVEQMLLNQANNFGQVLGSSGIPMTPLGKGELPNTGAVKGAAGVAFEGGVKSVVQKSLQATTQNAGIDFARPSSELRKIFNKAPGVYDAKYTPALADDVLTKLLRFAQPAVAGVTKPVTSGPAANQYIKDRTAAALAMRAENPNMTSRERRAELNKRFPMNKASGFIPNFSAVQDAVAREHGAGIPKSQIYIAQHQRLAAGYNPLGLGVFNKIDEPTSAARNSAVINRGYASGFIPNFADEDRQSVGSTVAALGAELSGLALMLSFNKNSYAESLKDLTKANVDKVKADLAAARKSGTFGPQTERETMLANTRIKEAKSGTLGQKATAGLNSGGAIAIASLAPIIAETIKNGIDQGTKDGRKAGAVVSGLGQTASLSATGFMVGGPIGAAVGALAGTVMTFNDYIKEASTNIPELSAAAKKASEKLSSINDSGQVLMQGFQQIQELTSGDTTPEKVQRGAELQSSLLSRVQKDFAGNQDAINTLSVAIQNQDFTSLKTALDQNTAAVLKDAQNKQNALDLQKNIEGLRDASGVKGEKESGFIKNIAAEIFKRANNGKSLDVTDIDKRIQDYKVISESTDSYSGDGDIAFKGLPGVNDRLSGKLNSISSINKYVAILEELNKLKEQQLATDKALFLSSIKGNKTIAAYVKILQNVSKLYSEYENSLKNTLSIQNAGNAAIRGAYAGINKSAGERDANILESFGNTTAAKSTSSNNGLRQLDLEFNNQISGVIDDLASSIALAETKINTPKGTDQVGSNGKNVEIAMSRIIDENARSIAATRSPEDIKKSLSSGPGGLNLDVLQKTIVNLEKMTGANASDETKTLLTQLKEKASKAIEVALQQKAILTDQKTLLANQNFAANVKELMDAVKLTGGGMTGFQKDDLTPLQNVEQAIADIRIALSSSDSKMGSVESGRAASNIVDTLSQFAGRNIGTNLQEDGPAMTAIIDARSKDLLGALNSMQSDNSKVGGKGKAVTDEIFAVFRKAMIEQAGLGTKTENGKVIQKSSDEMAKISNEDIAKAISTMQVRADANKGVVNKGVMDQSLLNLSPAMRELFNSQGNAGMTDINQIIAANTNQTNVLLDQIRNILSEPRPAPAPDTNAPTSPATTPEGWPVWFSTGAKNRPVLAKGSIPPGAMAGLFKELSAIKEGVGGASLAKGDLPYLTEVNGETVAVNTGEKIVENFMGTQKDAVLNRDMLTAAGGIIPHFAAEGSIPDSKYLMGRPRKATKMEKDILSKIPVPVTQILKGVGGNAARFAGPVGLAYSAYGLMDNFGGLPWSDESKKPKEMSPKDMPDYLKEYRTGPRPKFNKFADGFIPNSAENLPIDDYLQELSKTGGISGGSLSAMKTNAPTGFVDIIKNFLGKLGTSSSMARGLIPNLAVGKKSPFEFASLQSAKKPKFASMQGLGKPKFASMADGSVPDIAVTSKLLAQIKALENKLEMEKRPRQTERRGFVVRETPNTGPILDELSKLKAKYNSYKDNWELLGGRDKNVAGKQLNTKTGEFGDVPKAIDMRPIRADDMMARREYQMDKAGEQMDNISDARSAKEYISARIRGENDGKGGFMYAGDEAGYQEYVRGALTKYSDMKDSEQFQALAKEAGITNMAEGNFQSAIRAEYANNDGKATRVVDDQMSANGMSVISRDQVNADNARSQHGGPLKASMSSQAQQLNSRYMMPNMALGNNSSKNFSVNLKNDIKMDGGGGGGDVESKLTELGDQIKQLVRDNIESIAVRVGLVENQMAGFGQAAEYVKNMSSKNPEYNAPPRIRN